MKKQLLLILFALLIMLMLVGQAGATELYGKVTYQSGDYDFTLANDPQIAPYEFNTAAPSLRYELGLKAGACNLTGFFTTQDIGKGSFDDRIVAPNVDEADYGAMTAFGGDITYPLNIGPLKLTPSIGYRSIQVTAGIQSWDANGFTAQGVGFQTSGLRIAASTSASLLDNRFSLVTSLGYSPRLAVAEIDEMIIDYNTTYNLLNYYLIHKIMKPNQADSYDLAIAASVKVIPAIEIVSGYRYEVTNIKLDPTLSNINAYAYNMNARVLHVGAICRF